MEKTIRKLGIGLGITLLVTWALIEIAVAYDSAGMIIGILLFAGAVILVMAAVGLSNLNQTHPYKTDEKKQEDSEEQ